MEKVDLDIKHVAHLARLALSPEEEKQFAQQLGNVLEYIEKLKEVDITNIAPTAHAFPLVNVTRPDEIQPSLNRDEVFSNAPSQSNGLFLVPKIVE